MSDSKFSEFFEWFGTHKNMVLSTSSGKRIHSRMMSIVCLNRKFYFQTDKNFRKCRDIEENHFVSLCMDNTQIDGICKKSGKPADNKEFCGIYKLFYPKAYELYTYLETEVLYEIEPKYIERWIYEEKQPYLEIFDIKNNKYEKKKYSIGAQ